MRITSATDTPWPVPSGQWTAGSVEGTSFSTLAVLIITFFLRHSPASISGITLAGSDRWQTPFFAINRGISGIWVAVVSRLEYVRVIDLLLRGNNDPPAASVVPLVPWQYW